MPTHNALMGELLWKRAWYIGQFGTVDMASRAKKFKGSQLPSTQHHTSSSDRPLSSYNNGLEDVQLNFNKRLEELHKEGLDDIAKQPVVKEASKHKLLR